MEKINVIYDFTPHFSFDFACRELREDGEKLVKKDQKGRDEKRCRKKDTNLHHEIFFFFFSFLNGFFECERDFTTTAQLQLTVHLGQISAILSRKLSLRVVTLSELSSIFQQIKGFTIHFLNLKTKDYPPI